mmetsp:Transcript_16792/g.25242  ORF Transcript_16792/g.25242 Transcript_16792/m.25242 type:complete len:516 (+) Transcript_16792:115-1662(+)|eukprot:CAMPEP_0185031626 /NCGR_PEP_ID=MMETSP1103-20130426/19205_1 /TAXON_ID=36769 /ORGANISM="Paraphysomonas bandaiensis, Strain Caron Lab Isolate" /LENGTH=515 /DNA_ID=CAMNT_0027567201 /DNA_START=67 /DNA_END=1617 /DNA_ORIENTATION=-
MNKANALSAEAWPEWNISPTSPPVVTVEGHHIQGVFSMIHTQLETLRNLCIDQGKALIEASRKEERTNEKHTRAVSKLTERLEKLQAEIKQGETGQLTERLRLAEEKVAQLEKQLEMQSSSGMKTAIEECRSLSESHDTRLMEIQNRLSNVDIEDHDKKLHDIESRMSSMNFEKGDIHARVVHLEDVACWYKTQAEKMNEEYTVLYDNNEVSAREINDLKDRVYTKHENEIAQLFEEKMNASDGAAITAVLTRRRSSDQHDKPASNNEPDSNAVPDICLPGEEEIERLTNLVTELDRRLLLVSAECRDDIETVKYKADKKIDVLQKWIMKYVSNAVKDKGENDDEQIDIGRVRCIVCNHTSKKLDTDTPYAKPDFKNTLGYLHDGRPLPQEENAVYRSGFRLPNKEANDPKYRMSNSPPRGQTGGNASTHQSKFARLRAVPHSNSAEVIDIDEYRVDRTGVVDVTEDTITRPKTGEDAGVSRGFYKEMERRYIRPSSAPAKKHSHRVLSQKHSIH